MRRANINDNAELRSEDALVYGYGNTGARNRREDVQLMIQCEKARADGPTALP